MSEGEWLAVQARLARSMALARRNAQRLHLLSGLLKC